MINYLRCDLCKRILRRNGLTIYDMRNHWREYHQEEWQVFRKAEQDNRLYMEEARKKADDLFPIPRLTDSQELDWGQIEAGLAGEILRVDKLNFILGQPINK